MTKIVVTGASGNVGTAVLRRLRNQPEVELHGVARRPPAVEAPYDAASWHTLDLTGDAAPQGLRDVFVGADTVVHLVWAFQPTRDIAYLREVGVTGTQRVVEAAAAAGVRHVVYISSVGTYAPRRSIDPVDESYPHTGMPTSEYSVHKAAVEQWLDEYEHAHPGQTTITRVRPGIVLQRDAGAELSRYGLPAYLPVRLLRALPLLPLDRGFRVPVVHADDLADAIVRVIDAGAGGAFNVAHPTAMTREDVAATLSARPVHVPARALRDRVALTWRLHLQPLSPGWIDMAFAVPLQDSARAMAELGWRPRCAPREALAEAIEGMTHNVGTVSAVLRPRSALRRLRVLAGEGPISMRKRP
jgi:nucleoside-diphosphate-sugar epimerase